MEQRATPPGDPARPIRVLCVDDNAEVLRALKYMLGRLPGLHWAGGLSSTKELSAHVAELRADVLLLDYSIPGERPLEALRAAKVDHPRLGCIVFTGFSEPAIEAEAVRAGAARCLTKDVDLDELLDAIFGGAPGPS